MLAVIVIGCRHEPAPAVPWSAIAAAPAPVLALAEGSLELPAEVAAFAGSLATVAAQDGGVDVLLAVTGAMSAEDLAHGRGARLLAMHAVYRIVRSGQLTQRFDAMRGLVDRLHAAAPDAPETLFCRSFLRWIALSDGEGGLRLGQVDVSVARDLLRDLDQLLTRHPEFAGPAPFDTPRLQRERAAVATLVAGAAALPVAASPSALPTADTPVAAP
jgi:hypothetical protein